MTRRQAPPQSSPALASREGEKVVGGRRNSIENLIPNDNEFVVVARNLPLSKSGDNPLLDAQRIRPANAALTYANRVLCTPIRPQKRGCS